MGSPLRNEAMNDAQRWCTSAAMQPSRPDLADFVYLLAIARHGSFRRAAVEMASRRPR
jgi:hypothetical protein